MSDRVVTAYPLTWPDGWKRAKHRVRARFGEHSMSRAVREVLAELLRLGVPDWSVVISTNVELRLDGLPYSNQKPPADPGAAVWFTLGKLKERRVLAVDKWDRVEHNLWAIANHVGALRGQERWGVGSLEQAFRGYAALPDPNDWRTILGLHGGEPSEEAIVAAFRRLSLERHPDTGGSAEAFVELVRARDAALKAIGATSVEPTP